MTTGFLNYQSLVLKPATYSLDAIIHLVIFFRDNPDSEAELIGFSDTKGNP